LNPPPKADILEAPQNVRFREESRHRLGMAFWPLVTQSSYQVRPSLQRRWPSLIPNALAFWRNEPTERFISLEIFFTGSLSFEYRLSSAT
jgi:hypothetical protein